MTDEFIDSPLDDYKRKYKSEHVNNTNEFFKSLTKSAGTDVDLNIKTVKKIRKTESDLENQNKRRRRLLVFKTILILLLVVSVVVCIFSIINIIQTETVEMIPFILIVSGILVLGLSIFGIIKLNKAIKHSEEHIRKLEDIIKKLMDEAWAQMAPLNQCFDWDMPRKIMQKTLPLVKLDNHYTYRKHVEMQKLYQMIDSFGEGNSITHQQSGSIKGNPFVLFQYKEFNKSQKTYFGSLVIHWTEQQRTKDGVRTVMRSQTLTASVNAFYPNYQTQAGIIYFHDAAPDLSFDREPQKTAGMNDKETEKFVKSRNKKIDKMAEQAVSQGKTFTAMSNPKFDALFGAFNRNHEVQFRLLYTPVAQRETIKLIEDDDEGFSDSFYFIKRGKMNVVEPQHLSEIDLSTDPSRYMSYEYEKTKKLFQDFNQEYFRALYFSLAPLLAIPQYQQNAGTGLNETRKPHDYHLSEFEHEEIVNQLDIRKLRHEESAREDILKIRRVTTTAHSDIVEVSAHGYSAHQRITYIPVAGGDGFVHNVPVPWTEYLPIIKKTNVAIKVIDKLNRNNYIKSLNDKNLWSQIFKNTEHSYDSMVFARNTIAYITDNIGEVSDDILSKLYKEKEEN